VRLTNCIIAAILLVASTGRAAEVKDTRSAAGLENALLQLSPRVSEKEARQIAQQSHAIARQLRREYRVVGWAMFHNFLVNTKVRERGLCHEWAEDLFVRLQPQKLQTVELHWGEAWKNKVLEHNCVVVTAKGAPFESGIILDAWRYVGRLTWKPVTKDFFPWRPGRKPELQLGTITSSPDRPSASTPARRSSRL
jgi:hypothetical protein